MINALIRILSATKPNSILDPSIRCAGLEMEDAAMAPLLRLQRTQSDLRRAGFMLYMSESFKVKSSFLYIFGFNHQRWGEPEHDPSLLASEFFSLKC